MGNKTVYDVAGYDDDDNSNGDSDCDVDEDEDDYQEGSNCLNRLMVGGDNRFKQVHKMRHANGTGSVKNKNNNNNNMDAAV